MVTVRITPEATPVPVIQDISGTDSIALVSDLLRVALLSM